MATAHHQFALPLIDRLNRSPLDEALLLHDVEAPGFFALLTQRPANDHDGGRRLQQRSFRLEYLPTVLDRLDRTRTSYLSQAEFFKPNRRVVHLWRINSCFVDLDVYRSEWAGLSGRLLTLDVLRFCADEGIPKPSLIINSGRGLYLKWALDRPLPQAALPRWNAVQVELVRRLAPFGADPKARSASQVLRLVQTVNAKSGAVVRVVHVEEVDGAPLRWDFDELADQVLPFTRAELQALRADRAAAREARREQRQRFQTVQGGRKGPAGFSARSLAWARLEDLRTLQRLRGGVVAEGMRESALFWSLRFMLGAGVTTPQQAPYEAVALAREINPSFTCGSAWHECDLGTLYRRAQAEALHPGDRTTGLYWVTNQRLIELFQVTPDEERQLRTIVSRDERRRRNREQHREARRPDVEARAQARADRAEAIRRDAQDGLSQRQIAARHGVTQPHVNRILNGFRG